MDLIQTQPPPPASVPFVGRVGAGVSAFRDAANPQGDVRAAGIRGRASDSWMAPFLVLLPAVVIVLEGWSRRWVADDSYIDFRVIGNLTSGHGPVYNRGERVEAFTDPLWVAILSVFHFLAFLPIEWWAVLLGLGFSAGGVAFAARGSQRLALIIDGPSRICLPIGMLIFVSVDAAWDFATSGLETGLIFGWAGLSWWLLVRHFEGRGGAIPVAVIVGLGPLIRPDMFLLSAALLVGLAAISTLDTSGWPTVRRVAAQWTSAFALPAIFELFRMAYFGMLVPNTALAKTAASAWWSQGLMYLRDMIGPYRLWFPLLLIGLVLARRVGILSSTGRRRLAILLAAPVLGGLMDAIYVVRVGGDFMHGRMLLPALFAICMSSAVTSRSAKSLLVASAGAGWVVLAIAFFHSPPNQPIVNGIANERGWYIGTTGNPHPVTADEFSRSEFAKIGAALSSELYGNEARGSEVVLLRPNQGDTSLSIGVPSLLGEKVVAPVRNVGISGYAAGSDVYIFDLLSLSNPIGAHVSESERTRPGHSQQVSPVWMVARFVPPAQWGSLEAELSPELTSVYDIRDLSAARAALSCGTLSSYLHSVSASMTIGRAFSNIFHSFSYTRLRFSPDPVTAKRELCGA